ncbi:ankyrin repeat domain-containing protein [Legionella dresdenensis]|uniref:Ankyrin repeat domain-containing protein n=1 Tax=Legionella dresdenensis TaxID=450200 RepID=A0ABV8CD54_9GAMM
MPNILFDRNHIKEEEIKKHGGLIADILAGTLRYPKVKQLKGADYHGENVFRAKINKKDRLIYTWHKHQDQNKLFVLAINDHNYKKLKRQFIDRRTPNYQELEIADGDAPPVMNPPAEKEQPLEFTPVIPYKGNILILDSSQLNTYRKQRPLALIGPPGAGKTSILYSLMQQKRNEKPAIEETQQPPVHPALFLSPSEPLVNNHRDMYQAERSAEEPDGGVVFITWAGLLQSSYPNYTMLNNDAVFAQWLGSEKEQAPAKIVHYELSLIVALGVEKYRTLGQRQCHYSAKDPIHGKENAAKQETFISLLAKWQTYLEENRLIDPMVSTLPPQAHPYSSIYLDETQNLPPVAISSVVPLALNGQIVAALDSDQALFSSPYMHNCLKEIFYSTIKQYNEHQLTTDWRSCPEVTAVGNHLINMKYKMDSGDKRRPYKDIDSALPQGGQVNWIDNSHFANLKPYGQYAGTVVIVFQPPSDEEREQIKNSLGCDNILTPAQAIGLDFDTVILWNPFSQAPGIKSLAKKNAGMELSLDQWNALNALYVAIKRAKFRVFFYDKEQLRWRNLASTLLGKITAMETNHLTLPLHSDNEKVRWQQQVEHHLQNKNYLEAENIMANHLQRTKQEIELTINQAKGTQVPATAATEAPASSSGKRRRRNKARKKAALSTTAALTLQPATATPEQVAQARKKPVEEVDLRQLIALIQRNIRGSITKLLKLPDAERHLINTSNMKSVSILEWLIEDHKKQLLAAMLEVLSERSNTTEQLMNYMRTLCTMHNGASLFKACFIELVERNPVLIKSILEQVGDEPFVAACLNAPGKNREYLVLDCAAYGHPKTLQYLKLAGADLDVANRHGSRPIHIAALYGHVKIIQFLKEAGISLKTPNNHGTTLAHIAAQNGDIDLLEYLGQEGENLDTPNKKGETPLLVATKKGFFKLVQLLCLKGVNLNTSDKEELNIACMAAGSGNVAIVKLLQEKGVNFETSPESGMSPILHAAENGHLGVIKFLHRAGIKLDTARKDGMTMAHFAAREGHLNILLFMTQEKVDLHIKNQYGATPLHYAAQQDNVEIMKHLYKAKADRNAVNNDGETPAYIAAWGDKIKALEYLHQIDADLTMPANDHSTPLTAAASAGRVKAINFLCSVGVNPNKADAGEGYTPAYVAARFDQVASLKALNMLGAALDTPARDGTTPLFIAAAYGKLDAVEFLLGKQVSPHTPVTIAVEVLHQIMTETPLKTQKRVEKFIQDKLGSPHAEKQDIAILPHEIAQMMGHTRTESALLQHRKSLSAAAQIGFFSAQKPALEQKANKLNAFIQEIIKGTKDAIRQLLASPDAEEHLTNKPSFMTVSVLQWLIAEHNDSLLATAIEILSDQQKSPHELFPLLRVLFKINHSTAYIISLMAVEYGRLEIMKFLDEEKIDLNRISTVNGATLTYIAAQYNQLGIMGFLIKKKVNINTPTDKGVTPLHMAARNGQVDVVRLLCEAGADTTVANNDGMTLAYAAAYNGHLAVLEFLKQKQAKLDIPDNNNFTPLLIAIQRGHLAVVRFLYESGANIKAVDFNGATAAYLATLHNRLDILQYLHQIGAPLDTPIKTGPTPLVTAVKGGQLEIMSFLLDNNEYPLQPATMHIKLLKRFIAQSLISDWERVNIFIHNKIGSSPKKEYISILPHELAQLMGNQEAINLLKEHPKYKAHYSKELAVDLFSPEEIRLTIAAI